MIYLPPLRRLLLPSLICLAFILAYRSSHRMGSSYLSSLLVEQPSITFPAEKIPLSNLSVRNVLQHQAPGSQHLIPPTEIFYDFVHDDTEYDTSFQDDIPNELAPKYIAPEDNKNLAPLFECRIKPNRFTSHIRLPVYIRPISMIVTGENENEKREYLNAAPLSLPWWSENQYLLVTRVQTDGTMQLNIVCEANICYTDPKTARPGEKPCTKEDLQLLGGQEGMRCATTPLTLNVPPTPAKFCGNDTGPLIDVPGFHDPRIFWSGKGEPLMMMNTQSRYACFGLWVIDLRKVHSPLSQLLGNNPRLPTLGPLMSYPSMTEITRNPPETRGHIEKNWMFFSNHESSFVHYDMGPNVRTMAQLIGGGLTTPNLTDPYEIPCLRDGARPKDYEVWGGSWHQGTNSLRLVLCERGDASCRPRPDNTVFWALIHHKHKNYYALPLRYERYFIIWSSTPPFHMLAMSKVPVILANETVSGWELEESWDDDEEDQQMRAAGGKGKGEFAVFTYTPSIAYSWGRYEDQPQEKNLGYLNDEVILGVGMNDEAQGYARAKVADLLQCMRACPGRATERLDKGAEQSGKSEFFKEDDEVRDKITQAAQNGKPYHELAGEALQEQKDKDAEDEDEETQRKKYKTRFDDPNPTDWEAQAREDAAAEEARQQAIKDSAAHKTAEDVKETNPEEKAAAEKAPIEKEAPKEGTAPAAEVPKSEPPSENPPPAEAPKEEVPKAEPPNAEPPSAAPPGGEPPAAAPPAAQPPTAAPAPAAPPIAQPPPAAPPLAMLAAPLFPPPPKPAPPAPPPTPDLPVVEVPSIEDPEVVIVEVDVDMPDDTVPQADVAIAGAQMAGAAMGVV